MPSGRFRRRHYETVADIIRQALESNDTPLLDRAYQTAVAEMFANVFEHDNPRFDRQRFLSAAGVQ